MKSNHISKFVSIIGENHIMHTLNNLVKNSQKGKFKFEIATNPIDRYLLDITEYRNGKIDYHAERSRSMHDESYFINVASLLDYLKEEIHNNPSYEKELFAGIMGKDMGTFYSNYCEILVAGYIKYLGGDIKLNASSDIGLPDIQELGVSKMYHECKLFPDPAFEFASKVNGVAQIMATSLARYADAMLTVMVRDSKALQKKLPDAVKDFYETGKSTFDKDISIINFPRLVDDQRTSAKNIATNFELIFQFSGDYGPIIERYEKNLEKSIKQAEKAGSDELTTWSYFYGIDNINMSMTLVTQVTNTILKHTSKGHGLIYLAFNPVIDQSTKKLSYNYGVNAFNYKGNLSVNMETFEAFIHDKLLIPTIPMP